MKIIKRFGIGRLLFYIERGSKETGNLGGGWKWGLGIKGAKNCLTINFFVYLITIYRTPNNDPYVTREELRF